MGFWDSYNKKMVRQGYSSYSEFYEDGEASVSENEVSVSGSEDRSESVPDTMEGSYEREAEQALAQGDIETAMWKYAGALEQGNLQMLLKLADLFAIVALYDKYERPYRIGSDSNRDYSLEVSITFYVVSLLFPELESEAENHLNILQEQCWNEREFQLMVERVTGRISASIQKDPIGFVRAMLSQYNKSRSPR